MFSFLYIEPEMENLEQKKKPYEEKNIFSSQGIFLFSNSSISGSTYVNLLN